MFCRNCGAPTEEGAAFCGNCGAPLITPTPAEMPAPQPPRNAQPPETTPPGPTYAPGWGSPMGPRPRGNGGLIVGIVAAVIIVLAGAGVGVYFGLIRDNGAADVATDGSTAGSGVSVSTTAVGATASSGAQTTTTVPLSSTVQTVPYLTSTTGPLPSTNTTESPSQMYLQAQDVVVGDLEQDDQRIPELAAQINEAAPNVPQAVRDELQSMLDALDNDSRSLSALVTPQEFAGAFSWLEEAVMHMENRIQATIGGIEVMWNTGRISSSTPFFDTGRVERDAYRNAMQEYHDVLPIE
jgi:hypothetical protein